MSSSPCEPWRVLAGLSTAAEWIVLVRGADPPVIGSMIDAGPVLWVKKSWGVFKGKFWS